MYNEINFDQIDLSQSPPTGEPAREYYFIAKCRELVADFAEQNGRFPTACVVNMGCPMRLVKKTLKSVDKYKAFQHFKKCKITA